MNLNPLQAKNQNRKSSASMSINWHHCTQQHRRCQTKKKKQNTTKLVLDTQIPPYPGNWSLRDRLGAYKCRARTGKSVSPSLPNTKNNFPAVTSAKCCNIYLKCELQEFRSPNFPPNQKGSDVMSLYYDRAKRLGQYKESKAKVFYRSYWGGCIKPMHTPSPLKIKRGTNRLTADFSCSLVYFSCLDGRNN